MVNVELNGERTGALERVSQQHGVRPYMTMLSAWAVVLGRLSGQDDLVILAHQLIALGIGPDAHVALGGAYVPLDHVHRGAPRRGPHWTVMDHPDHHKELASVLVAMATRGNPVTVAGQLDVSRRVHKEHQ